MLLGVELCPVISKFVRSTVLWKPYGKLEIFSGDFLTLLKFGLFYIATLFIELILFNNDTEVIFC